MAINKTPIREIVRLCVRPLPAQITPLRALSAVERDPDVLFLESSGPEDEGSRWTLLAFEPRWRLEVCGGVLWRIEGGQATRIDGDPMAALESVWPERVVYDEELWGDEGGGAGSHPGSFPFVSGYAGYLSYDLKDYLECYPQSARRESAMPDLSLGFYDVVWIWDRIRRRGWAVSTGLPEQDPEARELRAIGRLLHQWGRIVGRGENGSKAGVSRWEPHMFGPTPRIRSNFTRDAYHRVVERALEHIEAGDIYQVNLAQRFRLERAPEPASLYRALREESPAPFSSFVTTPQGAIVSSSPERFFRIDGDSIETWPIKGTRPRGVTAAQDRELANALAGSDKDRAENVMIVDLERNDLGRICETGTVRVSSLCEVASYANVHHLVSRVSGSLRADVGPVEILRAMFPGGSITGAPKIRAIEIIDALEPTRRGPYTGAIGYWDCDGSCDFNIAIRTIVVEGGNASFHAGGGIVADSTPEGEYEETLVKARGMMRALGFEDAEDALYSGNGAIGRMADVETSLSEAR